MNGLEKSVKEIEALTYNAKTVINALIRSVIAAGSNKGFKATRVEKDIYLTRVDIYRIYKFYQDWQDNNYAADATEVAASTQKTIKSFDTLLAEHDETPVKDAEGNNLDTAATTTALVKHSQILFLNSDNVAQYENNDFWLNLIKTHNNPKLVTNTAPIPLNLRTPIFDANLSTAHYNTYPTYLFPMGYFSADILGFSGDNQAHNLDGKSWEIASDSFLRLTSNEISMGDVFPDATYKTETTRTGNYGFSWGYDCHAKAAYSVSGGSNSIVPTNSELAIDGEYDTSHAIAIGNFNIASQKEAVSIGGSFNGVASQGGAILGGYGNFVTGDYSGILAGSNNTVGGTVYDFRFPSASLTEEAKCVAEEAALATCKGETVTTTVQSPIQERNNIVMVRKNQTETFINGDYVKLFNFTFNGKNKDKNEYWEIDGSADQAKLYQVKSVAFVPSTDTSPDAGYTRITLDRDIPQKGIITGGKISESIATNSGAIGSYLIVEGNNQLAVGSYNEAQRDARFLVGAGSTSNSFEIYSNSFIAYGTPKNLNTFTENRDPELTFSGLKFYERGLDVLVGKNRLRLFKDVIIDAVKRDGFEVSGKIGESDEFSIKADTAIGIRLQNKTTNTSIHLINGESVNSFSKWSRTIGNINVLSQKDLILEGKNDVVLAALGGSENTSNLHLEWDDKLMFVGNTFGALPTDQNQYCHYLDTDIKTEINVDYSNNPNYGIMSLFKTGFYRVDLQNNPLLNVSGYENTYRESILGDVNAKDYYLLNSGFKDKDGNYFNWQMMWGTDPTETNSHIGVRRGKSEYNADILAETSFLATTGTNGTNIKHLAWLEDAQFTHTTDGLNFTNYQFGTWVNIPSELITVKKGHKDTLTGEVDYLQSNYALADLTNYTIDFNYTKINNTVFFEIILTTSSNAFTSYSTADDKIIALFIEPSPSLYRETFAPVDWLGPCFTDTRKYRNLGSELPFYKIYTCQPYYTPANGKPFFMITTSANLSDMEGLSGKENIFASEADIGIMYFSGSYQLKIW